MGGIYVDMEAFRARMVQDCNEMLELLGIPGCVVAFEVCRPVPSFWRRLRGEIANRPKVF